MGHRQRKGLSWACDLLENDFILSKRFLPSRVPLRVLPALHAVLPSDDRERGTCRKLARKYIWRAFFTSRYTSNAAHLLLSDYRGLKELFEHGGSRRGASQSSVPILKEELPTVEEVASTVGWPTRQGTRPRAFLTLSLMKGARDLCRDQKIDGSNIDDVEAHHIFPSKYLQGKGEIDDERRNNPLNCMLLACKTNRKAGSKPPAEYLSALYAKDLRAEIGMQDILKRLDSHLIPGKVLFRPDVQDVAKHYSDFVSARAKLMMPVIESLAEGNDP